jgi:hypothetical protein
MKRFKVLKVENEIMELFIAYGLCRILEDSFIPWTLTNKPSYFLIETEKDFNYRDLVLEEITEEDRWNLPSIYTGVEGLRRIEKLNEFFNSEENMEKIFSFYEDVQNAMDEKRESKIWGGKPDKEGTTYSGTVYYTKGMRGKLSPGSHHVSAFRNQLAFLGFLSTATYVATDYEVNAVLIPKQTRELRFPFVFLTRDKETGEEKRKTRFGKQPITIVNARLYVESLKKLKTESMLDAYDSILFMKLSPTGNKPMPDKTNTVPLIHASTELYDEWLKWLEWSIFPDEFKYALSAWLLGQTVHAFIQCLKVASKNKIRFKKERLEEWVQLQPEKVQEIFKHNSIKELGRGLGRLVYDGKGFPMQVALLNCQTVDVFVKSVRDILLAYKKEYNYLLLTDKQLEELMELVSVYGDDIHIISNAIVAYGSTIFEKKTSQEKENEK